MNTQEINRYIYNYAYYPPYSNTFTEYLPIGEIKFERLIEELRKAKHYIFLEYFIIEEGVMWNTILDILVEKYRKALMYASSMTTWAVL